MNFEQLPSLLSQEKLYGEAGNLHIMCNAFTLRAFAARIQAANPRIILRC